jgi:hypothetical protein
VASIQDGIAKDGAMPAAPQGQAGGYAHPRARGSHVARPWTLDRPGLAQFIVVGVVMHRVFPTYCALSPTRRLQTMSDILNKSSPSSTKKCRAKKRLPLAAMRADAESRVLTRDFEGALRAKIAKGQAAVIAEIKKASPSKGVLRADFSLPTSRRATPKATARPARPACRC